MHFRALLASAFALAPRSAVPSTSTDAKLSARASNATLQPWEITNLYTHSPSGRPGSPIYSYLGFTVTDANEIDAGPIASPPGEIGQYPNSSADCTAEFSSYTSTALAGRNWTCGITAYGPYTFSVGPGGNTEEFNLTIYRTEGMNSGYETYTRSFVAEVYFAVGLNMAGTCGGSGVCNWGQKDPVVYVTPIQTSCTGPEGYC
jgi:hypothetical protein